MVIKTVSKKWIESLLARTDQQKLIWAPDPTSECDKWSIRPKWVFASKWLLDRRNKNCTLTSSKLNWMLYEVPHPPKITFYGFFTHGITVLEEPTIRYRTYLRISLTWYGHTLLLCGVSMLLHLYIRICATVFLYENLYFFNCKTLHKNLRFRMTWGF